MDTPRTSIAVLQKNNKWQQLLQVVVAVIVTVLVYNFFVTPESKYIETVHETTDNRLQQEIDEANSRLKIREAQAIQRINEISNLRKKLHTSKQKQINLIHQLKDAKQQLQKATDSTNVYFYTKYINDFSTNKKTPTTK